MTNYTENMFEIPIHHISCDGWESKKERLLELVEDSDLDYQSNESVKSNFHQKGKYNKEVEDIFIDEINEFCNSFRLLFSRMNSSWFQSSETNDHHSIHNHGALGYTAVCYIEYDSDVHTPTQFIAPYLNPLTGNVIRYCPKVSEGSIVFFPSMIPHYTERNDSDKRRTIVSFNIDVEVNHQLNEFLSFIDGLQLT